MTMSGLVQPERALRRAAGRATRAPSVHNTQPWRLRLHPDELEFSLDRSRQLGVLDPTGRQLHLSLGCALLNARASLAASGLPVSVTQFPAGRGPDCVAVIRAVHGPAGDRPEVDEQLARLDGVLETRQTNRRRFADDTVPAAVVDTLILAAEAENAVLTAVVSAPHRQSLARLSGIADTGQQTNPAYRAELRAWTSGPPERRDGIPARVVPQVSGQVEDDLPIRDFDTRGDGGLPADTSAGPGQCLLVLGTASDDPRSWLAAGQALERVWLELTRAGFVASLFTQVVEVAEVRSQLRDALHLVTHPHVVLRVGRAPVTPSTSRRPMTDVLEVVDVVKVVRPPESTPESTPEISPEVIRDVSPDVTAGRGTHPAPR